MKTHAPLPAPPDIETDSDAERFAPVEFRARGLGSIAVCLGPWEVGQLQSSGGGAFAFIICLPGLRPRWHRPLPYAEACDRAVGIVRDWLEATPIGSWVLERARLAAGDRQVVR